MKEIARVESERSGGDDNAVSVVIASYNSAEWLPSTLSALCEALMKTSWCAEIVVLDDGSTDHSVEVLESLRSQLPYPMRVMHQNNSGRFLARWNGMQAARYDTLLLLDSRLVIHRNSLAYLASKIDISSGQTWNGHVVTDPSAPLVGQFWSVPTHVFWSEYLASPKPTLITSDNFDRVPKGTGFLVVSKALFERACLSAWPEGNAHLTSDDTKVLRFIAAQSPIILDPGFSGTYRPRATVSQFLSHGWTRGTLFVDSYAGTSPLRNVALVSLAIVPFVALVVLIAAVVVQVWALAVGIVAVALAGLAILPSIALVRHCAPRAVLAWIVFVVPFGAFFAAGLLRGLFVHRGSFCTDRATSPEQTT